MAIFFDLDGTLFDSRQRVYKLFQHLVPQSTLSFDEYWDLKRSKINHRKILSSYYNYNDHSISEFETKWMDLIEQAKWLDYDKPFAGVKGLLKKLKKGNHTLILVTHRQTKESVEYQFKKYNWNNLFDVILVSGQNKTKQELIFPYINSNEKNYILSDSGKDIIEGKALCINTVAISSGFLSHEALQEYCPDIILKSVLDFKI